MCEEAPHTNNITLKLRNHLSDGSDKSTAQQKRAVTCEIPTTPRAERLSKPRAEIRCDQKNTQRSKLQPHERREFVSRRGAGQRWRPFRLRADSDQLGQAGQRWGGVAKTKASARWAMMLHPGQPDGSRTASHRKRWWERKVGTLAVIERKNLREGARCCIWKEGRDSSHTKSAIPAAASKYLLSSPLFFTSSPLPRTATARTAPVPAPFCSN